MKNFLVILLFALFFNNCTYACEDGHWITDKATDGSVIILEDSSKWLVNIADRIDTSLWLPMDNIVVCDDQGYLINTDNSPPETAYVTAIQ